MNDYKYPIRENSRGLLANKKKKYINWDIVEQYVFKKRILRYFQDKKDFMVDIGAGEGAYSKLFAPFHKNFIIDEPDKYRLDKAKATLSNYVGDKRFLSVFGEELSIPSNSIDTILCVHLLQHITEKTATKILDNIADMIKTGGLFVLCFSENPQCKNEFNVSWQNKEKSMFTSIPESVFMSLVKSSHENVLQVRKIDKNKVIYHLEQKGFSVLVNDGYMPVFVSAKEKIFDTWARMFSNKVAQHKILRVLHHKNYIDRCILFVKE